MLGAYSDIDGLEYTRGGLREVETTREGFWPRTIFAKKKRLYLLPVSIYFSIYFTWQRKIELFTSL